MVYMYYEFITMCLIGAKITVNFIYSQSIIGHFTVMLLKELTRKFGCLIENIQRKSKCQCINAFTVAMGNFPHKKFTLINGNWVIMGIGL